MMNVNMFHLSLEQQFELQCLQKEFQDWERDQIVVHLLDSMKQLMVKDNMIRDLIKRSNF